MFICQKCNKTSQSGEKQHKEVVATRTKTYRYKYLNDKGKPATDREGLFLYKESIGQEIVKEISVCGSCHV